MFIFYFLFSAWEIRLFRPVDHPCGAFKHKLDSNLTSLGKLYDGNEATCILRGNFQVISTLDYFETAVISVVAQNGFNCKNDVSVAMGTAEKKIQDCDLTEEVRNKCVYQCKNTKSAKAILTTTPNFENQASLCEIKVDVQ